LIGEDSKEFAKRVAEAKPVVEFFLDVILARERDPHRLVLAAEKVVLPLIRAVKSPMEQEHFIASASRALSLSSEAIRASLAKMPKENDPPMRIEEVKGRPITRSSRQVREDLLRAIPTCYPETPLAHKVKAEYARIVEAPLPSDPLSEAALFEAEQYFGETPGAEAADGLLREFEGPAHRQGQGARLHHL
jgi:DNA primase